ncbi:hypothetical protein IP92_05475 [Pseudoduganella flava]|uniref:Uncharacterized protein n=1 Tax=Pseudoduganella flava TaxID=871742 RepID=A0A562PDL3_9BURK|nr:hypothetical protein [Pseudoduganella flava]QGZ42129.1 hypothetical protein GO485_25850 [Pseudoduganella flava]TWI42499.1 hypothetical protein IP92_05475 [Pseudoduganella flava]
MTAPIRTGAGAGAALDPAELAELHSLTPHAPVLKPREALHPEEEALSLPQPEQPDPKIELLNRALGAHRTIANPLWSGDPVPRLRGLQKALIAHALTLQQERRRTCLDALTVIEQAIRLRLRWQQMRRSEVDTPPGAARPGHAPVDDEENSDATPHAA